MSEQFWSQDDKDTWQTPDEIIDRIEKHIDIHLDPCAGPDTDIGNVNFDYPNYDGLEWDWFGNVFVNPPFSNKREWIQKAINEYYDGFAHRVIILTPDSTDVKSWWHSQLAEHCDYVWFSRGRIKYIDPETGEEGDSPTFGTALNFLGDFPDELYEDFADHGDMLKRM